MHRLFFVAAALAISCAGLVQANQLSNGGFETPVLAPNSIQTYAPGGEPPGFIWQVSDGNVDHVRLPLAAFAPTFTAFEGSQILDLNGTVAGSIRQDFITIPGRQYTVSLACANHPLAVNPTFADVIVQDVATTNNILDTMVGHSTSTSSNPDWQPFSANFTAAGALSQLVFVSLSSGADGGIFLDAVDVSLVPEPAALFVLPGIAIVMRRRR